MKLRLIAAALVVASTLPVFAAAPAPTLPEKPPGSVAILLGLDRVRTELGLTSLQRAVLNDIRSDYRDGARTIVARAAADPAQKATAAKQLERLTERSNQRALEVLNSSQKATFAKIERRFLGVWSLLDPAVQKDLGITDKQRAKLARVWQHYQREFAAVNQAYEQGEISHQARIAELYEIRYDASDDLRERLTNAQRAKLAEIVGRPIP